MSHESVAPSATVTIIDDDLATRDIVLDILEDAGYTAIPWDGVEDPRLTIVRTHPDLIIQDVRLGQNLTIWTLLDYIDTLRPARTPSVLLFTADREFVRTHRQTLEDRSCSIVEKPFDIDDFLASVADCLTGSRYQSGRADRR